MMFDAGVRCVLVRCVEL